MRKQLKKGERVSQLKISVVMLLLSVVLSGCATRSHLDMAALDLAVFSQRSTALTCAPEAADRCAMASPLHEARHDDSHRVLLLDQGDESLIARLHMIRAAQHSLLLQNYVLSDDPVSRFILDEMLAAARRGVQVRILVDAFISLPDPVLQATLERAHANFELKLYNPVGGMAVPGNADLFNASLRDFRGLNQRMHNKLFVMDGEHAIIGGRNTAGRYFDLDTRMNFLDLEVMISGQQVSRMVASFDQYWHHPLTQPPRHMQDVAAVLEADIPRLPVGEFHPRYQPLLDKAASADWMTEQLRQHSHVVDDVTYFYDLPGKPEDMVVSASDVLFAEMSNAQSQLRIQTPYWVVSRQFDQVLSRLAHVDIEVSTNSLASTDAFPVYAISRKERQRVLERHPRLTIYEIKPYPGDIDHFIPRYAVLIDEKAAGIATPMLADTKPPVPEREGPRVSVHGKLLLIDDHTSVITAHNFDPRSESYNTENGLIIRDQAFTQQMHDYFERMIAPPNSWVSQLREPVVPVFGHVNRALSRTSRQLPMFDLWPAHYHINALQCPMPEGADQAFIDACGDAEQPLSQGSLPEVRAGRRWFTGYLGRMMGYLKPLM